MTYWKDSMLTGIEIIDTEHKKLVAAIDELMDACLKGQGRTKIEQTLKFVADYTKQHFSDEEKLQAKYQYPAMAGHKLLHMQFITTVGSLEKEFQKDGPNINLTSKLNKSLADWLVKHISTEDKKLGDYIKSKGGK